MPAAANHTAMLNGTTARERPAPAMTNSANPSPGGGLVARQETFTQALGKKLTPLGVAPSPDEAARTAAEDFVAIALVQPLLKQLRDANSAAPPFAPGPAEKQFRGLADAQVARQIVKSSSFPLVDRVTRDLLKRSGASTADAATASTSTPGAFPSLPFRTPAR